MLSPHGEGMHDITSRGRRDTTRLPTLPPSCQRSPSGDVRLRTEPPPPQVLEEGDGVTGSRTEGGRGGRSRCQQAVLGRRTRPKNTVRRRSPSGGRWCPVPPRGGVCPTVSVLSSPPPNIETAEGGVGHRPWAPYVQHWTLAESRRQATIYAGPPQCPGVRLPSTLDWRTNLNCNRQSSGARKHYHDTRSA